MSEDYEAKAQKFLKATNTTFKAELLKHDKYFPDDKESRDIYTITLTRNERSYVFTFGQSTAESGLRLFTDRAKTKRTGHKSFCVPTKIMQKVLNAKTPQEKRKAEATLTYWFEKEHFSLGGICWDLGKTPTPYDVLASLTKNEAGTFEDFCADCDYDTDSIKAHKTYEAVKGEWLNVQRLWSDKEIEQLQEIN